MEGQNATEFFHIGVRGFIWLFFAGIGSAHGRGTWQLGAPMPVARQELATGVLDGKMYVIGGFDGDGNSTATVQVYDPIVDTWTSAQALPFAVNHNSASVAAGKLSVSVRVQAKCSFTIPTPIPGLRLLPPIMYTTEPRQWE